MTAYFRSRYGSKLRIKLDDDDRDCLVVTACDKYGFGLYTVLITLTSAERDAMVEALLDMDCTEADEWAAEEAA